MFTVCLNIPNDINYIGLSLSGGLQIDVKQAVHLKHSVSIVEGNLRCVTILLSEKNYCYL